MGFGGLASGMVSGLAAWVGLIYEVSAVGCKSMIFVEQYFLVPVGLSW